VNAPNPCEGSGANRHPGLLWRHITEQLQMRQKTIRVRHPTARLETGRGGRDYGRLPTRSFDRTSGKSTAPDVLPRSAHM
jgi:hypothetical protein